MFLVERVRVGAVKIWYSVVVHERTPLHTEDTTEADLRDLFQPFGRISRVYLAKDKETIMSRGFAFVSFVHRKDAAKAMDKLQDYGYDHLILKLEWARLPRGRSSEVDTERRWRRIRRRRCLKCPT